MPYTPEEKKRAITRLRRIRGQSEALENAIGSGAACSQVLQQLAAVRGAVNGLMAEVLEAHLRESFGPQALTAGNPAQAIDEVTALVRSYLR